MSETTQLGTKLIEARKKVGLSQRDVAAKTGVTDSQLSKIESGIAKQPTQGHLIALAEFYRIDPAELLTLAGYKIFNRLPNYTPYLRSKYDLPPEAVEELRSHFDYIKQKYADQDAIGKASR